MNKYGEIKRIKHDNISYIVGTEKTMEHPIPSEVFIPCLYFYIPLKKAKRIRSDKNLSKSDLHYNLMKNVDKGVLKELVLSIKQYLEDIKPEYILVVPYDDLDEDDYEKRKRVYQMFMERNGYYLSYLDEENADFIYRRI